MTEVPHGGRAWRDSGRGGSRGTAGQSRRQMPITENCASTRSLCTRSAAYRLSLDVFVNTGKFLHQADHRREVLLEAACQLGGRNLRRDYRRWYGSRALLGELGD